jgi:hypothetical protein
MGVVPGEPSCRPIDVGCWTWPTIGSNRALLELGTFHDHIKHYVTSVSKLAWCNMAELRPIGEGLRAQISALRVHGTHKTILVRIMCATFSSSCTKLSL